MNTLFDRFRWILRNFFPNTIAHSRFYAAFFWIIFMILLAACGPVQTTPAPPATEAQVEITTVAGVLTQFAITKAALPTAIPTRTSMPTVHPLIIPTFSVIPTHTPVVTPLVNKPLVDAWRTQIALATPVRTPVIPLRNDKLPRVYINDGNLYFQSGPSQSVQLTNSGKDRDPILSDDGKMIAFYRGEAADNLYSINSDGSREQPVITSEMPLLIGKGEIKSPTFVPGTHLLLFNTYLCSPQKGLYDYADCTIGVYSIDTATEKINKVVENISGNSMRDSNFEISSDGEYLSVAGAGYINIYNLSSGRFKIAYPNVLTYYVTTSDEYLPQQYWLPDSKGLIIICAADHEYNEPATPPWTYVAFRYTIGDRQAVKIPLDKFIIWDVQRDDWSISPDRKWLLFAGNETGDLRDDSLVYLGNLTNGNTQAYSSTGWPLDYCEWSPDSKHFVLRNSIPGLIGSVDGGPLIPVNGSFVEWVDATHYYYEVINDTTDITQTYMGEIDSN